MNILELEGRIKQRLDYLTDIDVYNKKPKDSANYPYLVFNIKSNIRIVDNNRYDWILEIDFWNDSKDDSEILLNSIYVKDGKDSYIGLNKSTEVVDEGFYRCDLEFQGNIDDSEKNISRFNQRYLLQVY